DDLSIRYAYEARLGSLLIFENSVQDRSLRYEPRQCRRRYASDSPPNSLNRGSTASSYSWKLATPSVDTRAIRTKVERCAVSRPIDPWLLTTIPRPPYIGAPSFQRCPSWSVN